jgi:hypothetical protein
MSQLWLFNDHSLSQVRIRISMDLPRNTLMAPSQLLKPQYLVRQPSHFNTRFCFLSLPHKQQCMQSISVASFLTGAVAARREPCISA